MKKFGCIIAVLLLLFSIQSTLYHLMVLKLTSVQWMFFNACVPSSLAYLAGYLVYIVKKDATFMYLGVLPMFFFGVTGLFVFPWSGMSIIPQIMHMLMIVSVLWLIAITFSEKSFKAATVGLLLSIFVFGTFIVFQQHYVFTHNDEFKRIAQESAGGNR
ncbi:MAG: hypothetical protein KBH06_08175 [Spirochaetes bacterium]|nr:hypothetical protein [Spirochaetota bacterium]